MCKTCNTGIARLAQACFVYILLTVLLSSAAALAHEEQPLAPAIEELSTWLSSNSLTHDSIPQLLNEAFAASPLSTADAEAAANLLWQNRLHFLRTERAAEMDARLIKIDNMSMPFWFKVFGDEPPGGRSLFISMHGGGGAPAAVNDGQYENQKKLYKPEEGVYLVPRAPTNSWNLWHEKHIDIFFDRLITNMIAFQNVNPDRVYLMGYSAGGDGVYQLAPRMADRWAAASMMAGHPNETTPDGLRNIAFAIHMGEKDSAYNRNRIAKEWKDQLATLRQNDSTGYEHVVQLHSGRGHWMNLDDAVAVPWMAQFSRRRFPKRVVWKSDDVIHDRLYWLQASPQTNSARAKVVAECEGNTVRFLESTLNQVDVLIHDDLVDMNETISVVSDDSTLFEARVPRTISVIAQSLLDRDEPGSIAYGRISVQLSPE
ncbi:MAG: hypothetical protein WAO83_06600 [Fuerstiella sp.]